VYLVIRQDDALVVGQHATELEAIKQCRSRNLSAAAARLDFVRLSDFNPKRRNASEKSRREERGWSQDSLAESKDGGKA
jgi:hypothetical protein